MKREIAVGIYGICYYQLYSDGKRIYVGWTPGVTYADVGKAQAWVETGSDVGIQYA